MNLYQSEDLSPGTLVVFYTRCSDCKKIILDCDSFYFGLEDSHKEIYAKHTQETGHEKFTLESLVRPFVCAECGIEWKYEVEVSEWQQEHYHTTGHSYYGFSPVKKAMYNNE